MSTALHRHLSPEEREKLAALGGMDWIRKQIAKARPKSAALKKAYVYTHAFPDGRVFYVGSGRGYRAKNFLCRNAAHKAAVLEIGKENVVVSIYEVPEGAYALAEEKKMMAKQILAGATLLQHIPADVFARIQRIRA